MRKASTLRAMAPTVVAHRPSEQGRALVDIQTPFHFGVGVIAGAAGLDPGLAALAAVTAHMAVAAVRVGPEQAMFASHPEALGNQAADILTAMLGVYVGRWIRQRSMQAPAAPLPAPVSTVMPPPVAGLGRWW